MPEKPKSGWKGFPSQDILSLFNYGQVYNYQSLPVVEENINNTKDEENPWNTELEHMTDKPFTVGRKYIDSRFVDDLSADKTKQRYFVTTRMAVHAIGLYTQNYLEKMELLSMLIALRAKRRNLVDVAML